MAVMEQPDRLHLRDYVLSAEIGAFQSERGRDQRLRFNLTVDLREVVSGKGDEVDLILSYDVLTQAVHSALADERYDLVETLAERIAAEVLAHPAAARIEVCVEKLDRGPGALGITIQRRTGQVGLSDAQRRWRMLVWDLPASIVGDPGTIILPPAPTLPLPVCSDPAAARRIALLALDQSAWALAAELCLDIAQTRTELEHAIDTEAKVVWAPARLAGDHPDAGTDPENLAFWLAERLKADSIEFSHDETVPLPKARDGMSCTLRRAKPA